jgi:DNA-binding NtrC family response regulator
MDSPPKILCADDQPDVLSALRLLLKGEGLEYAGVTSPAAVLEAIEHTRFDVLLMDSNYTRDTTGGEEGIELLERVGRLDPDLPVVVMTAWGNVQGAVEAMRRGARDYILKPWDNPHLLAVLRTQAELGRILRRARRLGESLPTREQQVEMVAESPAMREVVELLRRVAPSDANVLITGEHGTGKELVARRIHALSRRARGPFVPVDAGSLAEGVFESELFGHVKGAFTDAKTDRMGAFESADRGTLFFDEIGNLPLPKQAHLLRALQTGEIRRVGNSRTTPVDVRVLSATNGTVEIHLPPLRERREDIPPLVQAALARLSVRYQRDPVVCSKEAMDALLAHGWPGNVRELEHVVERALFMAGRNTISADDLGLRARVDPPEAAAIEAMTLEEAERHLIERALRRTSGNVTEAARLLGLSRSALYRRLERQGPGGCR